MSSLAIPPHLITKRDEHDERDIPFRRTLASLPKDASLRRYCPPVYDQLDLKSCSANAVAAAIRMIATAAGTPVAPPSRLFLYYNARVRQKDAATDEGASIRNAIKAAASPGACAETHWPYDPANVLKEPSEAAYRAAGTKVLRYFRIAQELDALKSCIAEGFPFVFGVQIFKSTCESVKATGRLEPPTADDTLLGSHAVLAVAYDDEKELFLALNSCGESFGDGGYLLVPYSYMTSDKLTYDFWTIREIG